MVDRQDIDALLISALYGELTPADEARLTTHLESHPADKSTLGLLTETRAHFRDSGFTGIQVDPPQAISALLLQEAARRAPKRVVAPRDDERVGWFARFVNSFARHPAMAAAAMIVVVAGIGGLIYSQQGSKGSFAEQTDDRAVATMGSAPAPAVATPTVPMFGAAAGSGSGSAMIAADPARGMTESDKLDSYRVDLADGVTAKGAQLAQSGKPVDHTGIVVTTPQPQPKDLADNAARDEKLKAKADLAKEETKVVAQQQLTPTKAPPVVAQTAPGARSGAAGGNSRVEPTTGYYNGEIANAGSAVGGGGAAPEQQKPQAPPPKATSTNANANDAALLAWAKDQHKHVTDLVRANNCPDAAKAAAAIAARANDYYNTNVANDRALKPCMTYIRDARDKDAERTNKARAQKKVDVNEVEPSPANIAK